MAFTLSHMKTPRLWMVAIGIAALVAFASVARWGADSAASSDTQLDPVRTTPEAVRTMRPMERRATTPAPEHEDDRAEAELARSTRASVGPRPNPPPSPPDVSASEEAAAAARRAHHAAPARQAQEPATTPSADDEELHPSGLPYRNVFDYPELVEPLTTAIPELASCHALMRELDDTVPELLTMRLETLVRVDPDDPASSFLELQYVNTPEYEIDDISCFADIFAEVELPAPEDGEEFAFRLESSTRLGPPSE